VDVRKVIKKKIIKKRDEVLKILAGKTAGFYLGGGTALSLFYFGHRESYDVDFFTKEFSVKQISDIIAQLSESIKADIKLQAEEQRKDGVRMMRYSLAIDEKYSLKIDFIEDVYKLIKPLKTIDDIPVLSIEDIYLRKLFAICGSSETTDDIGRKVFIGGRQEAKDFFDLYFLSVTFMPLSKFALQFCSPSQIESIIVWYRTYKRADMKLGLKDIITDKHIDFHNIERHFKVEIENMIKGEL